MIVLSSVCVTLYAAGLRLGMTGAVKQKVNELNRKVREKKAETAVTYPAQGLSGTAAKGKPFVSSVISVKDSSGTAISGTSGTDGKFNIDVTGYTFPMLIQK